jgi:hypothetical protein
MEVAIMAYGIQRRRHYYEGTIGADRRWHWVGGDNDPDGYPTIEAARERIREYDAIPYETSHGESGRPEYRVRRIP